MALDFLCYGEALWDLRTPAGVPLSSARNLDMRPGGAAVNVALALAKRGARVGLAAVISGDALGDALAARLAAGGVDVTWVERSLPRTGLLFAERGDPPRFVGYRDAEEPAPRLEAAWSARALVVTGLMPSAEHAQAVRAAAQSARARGALVLVDLNARPRVFRGRDPRSALGILGEADVVKASAEDARVLGLGDDPAALRASLRPGATLVITDGPRPARALGPSFDLSVEAGAALAGDALGAGDAFTAGLAPALLRSLPEGAARWERALREGHAAARAHLRRRRKIAP